MTRKHGLSMFYISFIYSMHVLHDFACTNELMTVDFFREKKLLVGSDDYGRELTSVQNLRKKHKRLEAELTTHEPAIQVCAVSTLVPCKLVLSFAIHFSLLMVLE